MTTDQEQVRFGSTDLYVTRLCQGTAFRHLKRGPEDENGQRVLRHCLDLGVNFFDTAKAYGWGGGEKALGQAIKGQREQVIICTKITSYLSPNNTSKKRSEQTNFSREYLAKETEKSLERLGTDYVDLLLLHQPDGVTQAEEIVESMDSIVRAGKTRYWGVSNYSGEFVESLIKASTQTNTSPPAGTEDYYNIAGQYSMGEDGSRVRQLERELFPIVRSGEMGLIVYSPVDGGRLTGTDDSVPNKLLSRLLASIDEVASGLEVSRAQVCIAWILTKPEVTSVLAGSESIEHVEENISGSSLVLPSAAIKILNQAHNNFIDGMESEISK